MHFKLNLKYTIQMLNNYRLCYGHGLIFVPLKQMVAFDHSSEEAQEGNKPAEISFTYQCFSTSTINIERTFVEEVVFLSTNIYEIFGSNKSRNLTHCRT